VRVHRIKTPYGLETSEGGFAIERADFNRDTSEISNGKAICFGQQDISAIVDLSPGSLRDGLAHLAIANTNLIHPRTLVPQLRGAIAAGETVLITAALALPTGDQAKAAMGNIPAAPDLAALEDHFNRLGKRVDAFTL
jgi:hypothetical protein